PAMAPATEFGFDLVDTFSCSTAQSLTQPGRIPSAGSAPFAPFASVQGDGQVVRVDLATLRCLVATLRVDADADGGADALGDLDHDLRVLGQELLGVLPALAELLALVRVPGARLLHDVVVDPDVEDP